MGRDNGSLSSLKPQPGQSYNPTFHPLPGSWAKQQMDSSSADNVSSSMTRGSTTSAKPQTAIQRALSAERKQHEQWEEWQGVTPGKPVYEDPRAFQNTLLPTARFGTDGRGY